MLNLTALVQLSAILSTNITFSDEWREFVVDYLINCIEMCFIYFDIYCSISWGSQHSTSPTRT